MNELINNIKHAYSHNLISKFIHLVLELIKSKSPEDSTELLELLNYKNTNAKNNFRVIEYDISFCNGSLTIFTIEKIINYLISNKKPHFDSPIINKLLELLSKEKLPFGENFPLHLAIQKNNIKIIELILKLGDILFLNKIFFDEFQHLFDLKDQNKYTIFLKATIENKTEIVELILNSTSILHRDINKARSPIIEQYTDQSFYDPKDTISRTLAIHYATEHADGKIFKTILKSIPSKEKKRKHLSKKNESHKSTFELALINKNINAIRIIKDIYSETWQEEFLTFQYKYNHQSILAHKKAEKISNNQLYCSDAFLERLNQASSDVPANLKLIYQTLIWYFDKAEYLIKDAEIDKFFMKNICNNTNFPKPKFIRHEDRLNYFFENIKTLSPINFFNLIFEISELAAQKEKYNFKLKHIKKTDNTNSELHRKKRLLENIIEEFDLENSDSKTSDKNIPLIDFSHYQISGLVTTICNFGYSIANRGFLFDTGHHESAIPVPDGKYISRYPRNDQNHPKKILLDTIKNKLYIFIHNNISSNNLSTIANSIELLLLEQFELIKNKHIEFFYNGQDDIWFEIFKNIFNKFKRNDLTSINPQIITDLEIYDEINSDRKSSQEEITFFENVIGIPLDEYIDKYELNKYMDNYNTNLHLGNPNHDYAVAIKEFQLSIEKNEKNNISSIERINYLINLISNCYCILVHYYPETLNYSPLNNKKTGALLSHEEIVEKIFASLNKNDKIILARYTFQETLKQVNNSIKILEEIKLSESKQPLSTPPLIEYFSQNLISKNILPIHNANYTLEESNYDLMLNRRRNFVSSFKNIELFEKVKNESFKIIIPESHYPCIIFCLKNILQKNFGYSLNNNYISTEASSIVKIIQSYFVGSLNFYSVIYYGKEYIWSQNQASFGSLRPSFESTNSSFRFSPGLVPDSFSVILQAAIQDLNNILLNLTNAENVFLIDKLKSVVSTTKSGNNSSFSNPWIPEILMINSIKLMSSSKELNSIFPEYIDGLNKIKNISEFSEYQRALKLHELELTVQNILNKTFKISQIDIPLELEEESLLIVNYAEKSLNAHYINFSSSFLKQIIEEIKLSLVNIDKDKKNYNTTVSHIEILTKLLHIKEIHSESFHIDTTRLTHRTKSLSTESNLTFKDFENQNDNLNPIKLSTYATNGGMASLSIIISAICSTGDFFNLTTEEVHFEITNTYFDSLKKIYPELNGKLNVSKTQNLIQIKPHNKTKGERFNNILIIDGAPFPKQEPFGGYKCIWVSESWDKISGSIPYILIADITCCTIAEITHLHQEFAKTDKTSVLITFSSDNKLAQMGVNLISMGEIKVYTKDFPQKFLNTGEAINKHISEKIKQSLSNYPARKLRTLIKNIGLRRSNQSPKNQDLIQQYEKPFKNRS